MVPVLVVLSFAILVALDYFVLRKRYPDAPAVRPAKSGLQALSAAYQPVPAGVFLQPTYTWSRLGRWGEVYVGVHPMLLGLIGSPVEFELLHQGQRISKGQPLVRIGRAGRRLTVRSPISGRVDRVNHRATGDTEWRGAEGQDGAWLYCLQPDRILDEIGAWWTGEPAAGWTRRQYDDLRAFLYAAVTDRHLGVMMADGGELPIGILGTMDEGVWSSLEARFLTASGAGGRR